MLDELPHGTFKKEIALNTKLNSGAFATVCRGTIRESGERIAVKCIFRNKVKYEACVSAVEEAQILKELAPHPNILQVFGIFVEPKFIYIPMELCSGGDVLEKIGVLESYSENDARTLLRGVLEALAHCHEHQVAHNDLKPANLLLMDEKDDSSVKLADFGFARRVSHIRCLKERIGTPYFMAPEVILVNDHDESTGYDTRADMWSMGVLMYVLLTGQVPFDARDIRALFRVILEGEYEYSVEMMESISDEAMDLVQKLLVQDPSERLSAKEALQSAWFRSDKNSLSQNDLSTSKLQLKGFNARMKLRLAMLTVKASVRISSLSSLHKQRKAEAPPPPQDTSSSSTLTEQDNNSPSTKNMFVFTEAMMSASSAVSDDESVNADDHFDD